MKHPALMRYSANLTETGPAVLALMRQHLPHEQYAILLSLVSYGDQSAPELLQTVQVDPEGAVAGEFDFEVLMSAMHGLFARRLVTRDFTMSPVDQWSRG